MTEATEQLRAQIKAVATSKYPAMQNFTLSDNAIKRFMKVHKGDINSIVDELYSIVGKSKKATKIKMMSEAKFK